MESVNKKRVAKKMNPVFGKENHALSFKNKVLARQIENSRLLESPVSKYRGSVEDEVESSEGWVPGLRELFDTALHNGDKMTVKALLPHIPSEYAESFGKDIHSLLQGQTGN